MLTIINEEGLNKFADTLSDAQQQELVEDIVGFLDRGGLFYIKYYESESILITRDDDNTITFTCSNNVIMASQGNFGSSIFCNNLYRTNIFLDG